MLEHVSKSTAVKLQPQQAGSRSCTCCVGSRLCLGSICVGFACDGALHVVNFIPDALASDIRALVNHTEERGSRMRCVHDGARGLKGDSPGVGRLL